MNKMIRLGMFAVLGCMMLLGAACSKQLPPVDSGTSESAIDTALPTLTGEALRAADEITNAVVYFEFDKFDIRADSQRLLARKAELLKQFPQIKVSIQGNCDDRGTEEYNLALGERRARAAQEFLAYSGVNPTQLEIVSFGKLRPAVMGNNEAAWAKNRRDEFVVLNPRGK